MGFYKMNKKVWFFIDIDGCILPNMFNNAFYSNDEEKVISIISAYNNAKGIELYPEFIEFYKRIVDNEDYDIEEITFVTGRQENVFGWITDTQLKPLEKIRWFYIHYFYNFGKHTWKVYKHFKIHTILNSLQFSEFRGLIKIYDDLDLSIEFQESLDKDFEFYLIENKEDWNEL